MIVMFENASRIIILALDHDSRISFERHHHA